MSKLDPYGAYKNLKTSGEVDADFSQEQAMEKLQTLFLQLDDYGKYMGRKGWRARLSFGGHRVQTPKGLYIWGGVGRGKSMLMDLFFRHSAIDESAKKYVHFHTFMAEVHSRVHSFREAQKVGRVAKTRDPLLALSKVIIDQAWLLCFDEFHVTDIADAMVLGRLFEALFEQGVIVVATSNRHPNDLYKDGLQRDRFLPFIDCILEHMDVVELSSSSDYRLDRLKKIDVYITPASLEASRRLENDFERLVLGTRPRPMTLDVNGRELCIPNFAEGVAFAYFNDLCGKPLGPSDYLAIANSLHTLVLADIPKMGPHLRDQARRFIILIDALYEANVNLICSAEAPPMELYVDGDGAFEFERTASRLIEMQSESYQIRYKSSNGSL